MAYSRIAHKITLRVLKDAKKSLRLEIRDVINAEDKAIAKAKKKAAKEYADRYQDSQELIKEMDQHIANLAHFEKTELKHSYFEKTLEKALNKIYKLPKDKYIKVLNKIRASYLSDLKDAKYIEVPADKKAIYKEVFVDCKIRSNKNLKGGIRIKGARSEERRVGKECRCRW